MCTWWIHDDTFILFHNLSYIFWFRPCDLYWFLVNENGGPDVYNSLQLRGANERRGTLPHLIPRAYIIHNKKNAEAKPGPGGQFSWLLMFISPPSDLPTKKLRCKCSNMLITTKKEDKCLQMELHMLMQKEDAFTVFIQYLDRGQLFHRILFQIPLASSNGHSAFLNILHEGLYSWASFDSTLFTKFGNVFHMVSKIVYINCSYLPFAHVCAVTLVGSCWGFSDFPSISSRPQCASSIGSNCEAKQWGRAGKSRCSETELDMVGI